MSLTRTLDLVLPPLTGLNHFFRLDRYVFPDDDFAATAGEWVEVCRLWGHIRTLTHNQRVQNRLIERQISHIITTRYHRLVPITNDSLRLVDLTCSDRAYNVDGFFDIMERHDRYEWEVLETRAAS